MAEAVIKGLLSSKIISEPGILVSEIEPKRRRQLAKTYQISVEKDNQKVAALSDIVILSVKPQVLPEVVQKLEIRKDQILISIAAGVRLKFLERAFPGVPVIRAMPNNPALVQAGISALAAGKLAGKAQLKKAFEIFAAVGEVVEVEEKRMDAVTGLSGSGPAFVYLVIEALARAGQKLGIKKNVAEKLALQTVLGSARTMLETRKSARELREMVASPGGTTIEGLKVLKKRRLAEALVEAVGSAAKKSKKLSR
jgi:pyrroline-5-carboxylate reductase